MLKQVIFLLLLASIATAKSFNHPGTLDSRNELDFVRRQIASGKQPWAGEFGRLVASPVVSREPHGRTTVNSSDDAEAQVLQDDAIAAYGLALLWKLTSDDAYATRATVILNSWNGLERFASGTDQDKLQAGWTGVIFASAAELLRDFRGWRRSDVKSFRTMLRRAFLPQLATASRWNGNVDLTQIAALAAIAVFDDDRDAFDMALTRLRIRVRAYYYLTSDGPLPPRIDGDGGDPASFWFKPAKWVDGLTQESCRDNGHHAQFAIGATLQTAEIAWHQGVDLYAELRPRLVPAMELLAGQLHAGSMMGVCKVDAASADRYDGWELGFNHFKGRRGVSMPETARLIVDEIRPKAPRAVLNLAFSMLTHGVDLKLTTAR